MNVNHIRKLGITNLGDPFILCAEGVYYLYATSFIDGFYCRRSDDLIHWSEPVQVYQAGPRSFGNADFWAPEVVYYGGRYLMHYTARAKKNDSLRIGVAVSDSPLGPFIDVYDGAPMFDFGYAVIDGHVFIDGDKRYFYYDRDCSEYVVDGNHESHIYVAELDETLTKLASEPTRITHPEQDWETATGDFRWNEGACVVKRDGVYFLMFSSGFYAASTYSMGYATSASPTGPFVKYANNPILHSVPGLSGPGHNSVFTAKDGTEYCVFHVHTDEKNPSQDRQACICPIRFEQGKIILD